MNTNMHSLYICYFGLKEPLVQTQVLPYLREIKKIDGLKVSLLTFEPNFRTRWTKERIKVEREGLASDDIRWYCLPYHKRFSVLATAYDIFRGVYFVLRIMRSAQVEVLHARVHVPAVIGLLARKLSSRKPKLLFDIRGFVPEEYKDAGIINENGLIYKTFKSVEKWIMQKSDGFVVLTEKAREILFPESICSGFDKFGRPVEVIPCCVDFKARFQDDRKKLRSIIRGRIGIGERLVLTHLGALGGLYLTEELANFMHAAKTKYPDTFAMFLTQSNPDLIVPLLKERGFTENDYFVDRISPREVQHYLSAADIALSFVKSTYSTASRSPTKIPEYMACGLPIVSNQGVGDVDALIGEERVGVLLKGFNKASYLEALENVLVLKHDKHFVENSTKTALVKFGLVNVGGKRYRHIYNKLLFNK